MNNDIDWFGDAPKNSKKNKTALKSGSVFFLTPKNSKTNKTPGIPAKINFFGLKNNKNSKMKPTAFFRKESIKKGKLSKWGDADMDGSPNYFDCDPRKVSKDANPMKNWINNQTSKLKEYYRTKKGIKGGVLTSEQLSELNFEERPSKKKITREESNAALGEAKYQMALRKKEDRAAWQQNKRKQLSKIYTKLRPGPYSPLKEEKEMSQQAQKLRESQDKAVKQLYASGKIDKEAYDTIASELEQERETDIAQQDKLSKIESYSKNVSKLLKESGLKGARNIARFDVETTQAAGKTPTAKQLAKLNKAEQKMKLVGNVRQEGRISREIMTKMPGGQIGRVATGAALSASGDYTKELRAKSARVRRMTAVATGALFGDSMLQRGGFNSEPRGRGRPPGPSGEYKIGGKPVYEEEFQQYSIKQNALNRMLPSNVQSQSLNPEYIAYMKAKAVAERQGLGEGQTQNPQQAQMMTEEGMPMEGEMPMEETEMPTTGTSMMQTGEQQEMIRQKRAYTRAMPDEIRMAQQQAQSKDNILNAPNFMRGELKATGGSLLTPIGPSILEAPQVFKGEMRNVTKPNIDEGEITIGQRPQVNYGGTEFLEIDLMSNKPIIKRRITEKFMTGESL